MDPSISVRFLVSVLIIDHVPTGSEAH